MKSISKVEQRQLDRRVKSKLKTYIDKLDHSPETILNDSKKAKRVEKTLKKKGRSKLAEELSIVTSKNTKESVIIEKMGGYISHDVISADVSSKEVASEAKLSVAKVAVEAIQGLNDMVSSRFLIEGAKSASTVGRISKSDGPEAIGTGFMISRHLLMTNNHVLESKSEAKGCYIEFDYYHSKDSTRIRSEIFVLKPEELFHTNEDFDYTIVKVDEISDQGTSLSRYGWNDLNKVKAKVEPADRLNIIHHPLGLHQQISIRKNYVVDIENDESYVDYVTDTDYGSSGSPVYNDEWDVIALHRGNTTIEDDDKDEFLNSLEDISKDMANEMKNKIVSVNVGVLIEVILENIKSASISMSNREQNLIDQIFVSVKDKSESYDVLENIDYNSPNIEQNNDAISPIAQHITINGGNVTLNLGHGIKNLSDASRVDSSGEKLNSNVDLELYNQSLTSQKSIFKALDYVQKARELPYLPKKEDIENTKSTYYGDIIVRANNLTKAKLYDELSAKMQSTFKLVNRFPDPLDLENTFSEESSTPSSYHKARAHIYTWIDLQPNGSLKGIYSGSVIAPEQLMLVDLINSLDNLDYELPKRYKNSDYLNCEHIVPKTYFNRKEEGFSDLHHLITADGSVNKFRNKDTFADLGQQGDDGTSRLPIYVPSGGWKRDGHFEPARGKSLVARATLYFIIAHPKFLSTDVYSLEQIKTLIDWSNLEEPSDYEKHRNETIYEIQGNRNPLIDFPDWVDKIDFKRGMEVI